MSIVKITSALIGAQFGILALFMVNAANAQLDWPQSEWNVNKPQHKRHVHRVRKRRPAQRRSRRKVKPRVKSAVFRKLNGFVCAREFHVTGQVKSDQSRAKQSAWAAFHGDVKFQLGERYADSRYAKNPRFECARSTSETLTSKTIQAVGGGGVYRHRCRLRAVACKPPESD